MQDRARATRKALLESAAHLFVERGYAGTSINDISDHSGRTSGAIYFHYSSKEKLALAVVRAQFATWPQLAAPYTARDVPPLERLVALSYGVGQALREDVVARAGALLWAERRSIDAAVPTPFDSWAVAATRLLAEARGRGELADGVEPAGTATTLVCSFFGLCTLNDEVTDRRDWATRLDEWWVLVLNSLQAHPAPEALVARARARLAGTGDRRVPVREPVGAPAR
ncbi:ScbR family autoregulator-binding transcription factor [uncultured Streptomyces sp.]|uniref:ScbR family autoregulator-binding transcription factor n=1 Tax=uncultured Streptomyces sp. TaxID=174707 RepID=UPI00260D4C88|nr:ScbR family autoregulator-binding transcription factor [uncultured Streptomyces sp.]